MKILPIALFLATMWLASSASRLPRQLRVTLPLPMSSAPGERRKSGLFPKMNTKFVVTERALKMAATVKMAAMRRTNALFPNLNLKNKIMGDKNTKRMASGSSGIAIKTVGIRRFNLTKPVATPATTRAPAVVTRRPLARIPTYTSAESNITKEAPELSTKPGTRTSAQVISDSKTKNVTDKHSIRPQTKPYVLENENITVEGTFLDPVKPPLRRYPILNSKDNHNITNGDALNEANKHLVPHTSQLVDEVKAIHNMTGYLRVVTTKRPYVTPATEVMVEVSNEAKNIVKGDVLELITKRSSTEVDASEDKQQEETAMVRVKRLKADSDFTNSLDSSNKRQISSSNSDMPSGLSYRDWILFRW